MASPISFEELVGRQQEQEIIDDWPALWALTGEGLDVDAEELTVMIGDEGEIVRRSLADAVIDAKLRYNIRDLYPEREKHVVEKLAWEALTLPDGVARGGRGKVLFDLSGNKWYGQLATTQVRLKGKLVPLARQARILIDRDAVLGEQVRRDFPGLSLVRVLNIARIAQINVPLRRGINPLDQV
jgi:hypothetical protein